MCVIGEIEQIGGYAAGGNPCEHGGGAERGGEARLGKQPCATKLMRSCRCTST